MRIGFLYNAQDHQLFHSLPIAAELSRLHPEHEVVVLARSPEQLELARRLAAVYPGPGPRFEALATPAWVRALPAGAPKLGLLVANARRLDTFDALVAPERTTLHLRRMGVRRPRFIHTFHGSSGHDRVDDPRLAAFDLLLAPSERRLQRIARAGQLRPGHAALVGYVKFDLVERLAHRAEPLFPTPRPVVLYNPHHRPSTSSWPSVGRAVLDHFAGRDDFNLIFAPHVRLFSRGGPPSFLREYEGLAHMHIDPGSLASIDMTYLHAADVYLGDASSQVVEFVRRPRPCIFLNPRRLDWGADPDFANWRLGRVIERVEELDATLATRTDWGPAFAAIQAATAAEAFPDVGEPPSLRAARAIVEFMTTGRLRDDWLTAPARVAGALEAASA